MNQEICRGCKHIDLCEEFGECITGELPPKEA